MLLLNRFRPPSNSSHTLEALTHSRAIYRNAGSAAPPKIFTFPWLHSCGARGCSVIAVRGLGYYGLVITSLGADGSVNRMPAS